MARAAPTTVLIKPHPLGRILVALSLLAPSAPYSSSPNISASSNMAKFGDESDSESNPMDWDDLVKEEDSNLGSDAPGDEELALRIAIKRSRLDTDRSSSSVASATSSSRLRLRNAGRARPSRSAPLQIRGRADPSPFLRLRHCPGSVDACARGSGVHEHVGVGGEGLPL